MRRTLVLGSVIGALLACLSLRAIVLATVRSTSDDLHAARLPEDLRRAEAAFDGIRLEITRALLVGAQHESLRRALVTNDDTARRRRAFEAVEAIARDLGEGALRDLGRPDFVALVDASGRTVVRDLDPNRMRGRELAREIPAIERAIRTGRAAHGMHARSTDGTVLLVVAQPLEGGQALVAAHPMGDGIARRMAAACGSDVGLLAAGRVLGNSRSSAALLATLGRAGRDSSRSDTAEIEGESLRIDLAPLATALDVPVTLARVAEADATGMETLLGRLLLGASAVLALVAYLFADRLARRALVPVATLEHALLAVMNGQERLGVELRSDELGGLAFRMEQVIETLLERAGGARRPRSVGRDALSSAGAVQASATEVMLRPMELVASSS